MKSQSIWDRNSIDGVSCRKVNKTEKADRVPFKEKEIKQILGNKEWENQEAAAN